VTRASLLRATRRMTARQLDDVIDRLIDEGRVAMQKETGGRGRPSMIIRLM
jgi:predicted ArsR family transcriptional regulator